MTDFEKFADNPFLIGHDNPIFKTHDQFGFVHQGGDFLGKDCFVSFKSLVQRVNERSWSLVSLNMGDSSTSGWDSDKVSIDRIIDSTAPFFHYRTYSDLMMDLSMYAINAGVSGYSSLQGDKYLKYLLRQFARSNIVIHYVTLYFGNNDSVYSRIEDKVKIELMQPSDGHDLCRVTVEDFRKNMSSMIETARNYGVQPIIIVPVVNLFWRPGLRSAAHEEEYGQGLEKIKDSTLKNNLVEADKCYSRKKLHKAYMKDNFLPRIKPLYIRALKKLARKLRVPIIKVQEKIPTKRDDNNFRDYCHPLEPINEFIATKFKEILLKRRKLSGQDKSSRRDDVSDTIYPFS